MNPVEILAHYYDPQTDAWRILTTHSRSVADKALSIARQHPELRLDLTFIEEAALLHDIGIFLCNAPAIDCHGDAPYICHGFLGAHLMRKEGYPRHALVCERHTGVGISLDEIVRRNLPLPHRDMLPRSLEEQLICFADKFFSKTRLGQEEPLEDIRSELATFGPDALRRFEQWRFLFL